MTNKNATAANEADAQRLICDCKTRAIWQVTAEQFGKARADRRVAKMHGLPLKTVRAARYYW